MAACAASAPIALGSAAGVFAVGAAAHIGYLLLASGAVRAPGTLLAAAAGALVVRQLWRHRASPADGHRTSDLESQAANALSPGRLKVSGSAGTAVEIHIQSGRYTAGVAYSLRHLMPWRASLPQEGEARVFAAGTRCPRRCLA